MLEYFKREKNFLRKIAHEFSMKFPKVAGHLNFGAHDSGDPQVERLIESFAFLTGNIQRVIDGEFPEVTTALLGILYPNLINPIPSMSIARFDLVAGEVPLGSEARVPRYAKMFAQTTSDMTCFFRTAYQVDLVPIEVSYAGMESVDQFEFLEKVPNVNSVLRIKIKPKGEIVFSDFKFKKVRFYLNGDPMVISQLYETIFSDVTQVMILAEGEGNPIVLPDKTITPVGFHPEEEVIPSGKNSHPAFTLIQEYFCFPEKYYFIDIHNLENHTSEHEFDLLLALTSNPKLDINENSFVPNCAPIINLFEKSSISVELDNKKAEYHLVPDADSNSETEIHSIISVSKSYIGDVEERKIEPFYAFGHEMSHNKPDSYWYVRREESWHRSTGGTETYMSFRDLSNNYAKPDSQMVYVKALCTNRNLAEKIPAGALLNLEQAGIVQQSVFLKKPTAPITPPLRGPTLWNLISNLSLNYLSLSDSENSLTGLRSILRTYNFAANTSVEQQIMGLVDMECKKTLSQTTYEGWRGFCKGLEITLIVDPSYYAGSSAFLFASVLRRFFSLYVSINSFAETVLKRTTQEGIWKRWTPIMGKKATL